MSSEWKWSTDPFSAFRVKLVYGRNKHDRKFLPVAQGIVPEEEILPEGKFRVIKTKAKGTILIVPGKDDTSRCLLFIGCAGGFRGGVGVVYEATTGKILKECSAGNACESSVEVIVLLDVGQSICFHSTGRGVNSFQLHTWNGSKIKTSRYSKEEWENRNLANGIPEDAEVL